MLDEAFVSGHDLHQLWFCFLAHYLSRKVSLLSSSFLTTGKFQVVQTLALSLLVRDLANVTTADHPEAKYRHTQPGLSVDICGQRSMEQSTGP